jgi:ribonuclease Z
LGIERVIRICSKPEYAQLTGPQIVELKKQGVQIDYPLELPIVSYFGDTQYVDFSKLKYIAESKILIAECTFLRDGPLRQGRGRPAHAHQ